MIVGAYEVVWKTDQQNGFASGFGCMSSISFKHNK